VQNKIKGNLGENLAAKYLSNKGYALLHRNWTCHWGELDIVAENKGRLIFVEVKYRGSDKFGIEENISYIKSRSLLRTINRFLIDSKNTQILWQLDYIFIFRKSGSLMLRHYQAVPVLR
jgi:putative endonuclease